MGNYGKNFIRENEARNVRISVCLEDVLLFKNLKPYLQIRQNFAVVDREDWSYRLYKYWNEIPDSYDDMFVYGIGIEDNFDESDKNKILQKCRSIMGRK